MGDQPSTRADLGRLTATLNALTTQYKIFINQLNNNKSKTYRSKAYIKVMSDQMTTLTIQILNAVNNKPEFCDVLPPLDAEEKLNLESEVQMEVKSKTVETTIDEERGFNLELEGCFNVNNNGMSWDIQTKATPEIEEKQKVNFVKLPTESHKKPYTLSWSEKKLDGIVKETINAKLEATRQKKKADADKPRRYKYIVAISNSMNISDSFDVADSHEYQAFNQDENSGSSSFEVEEKVKTSKALMYGASTRLSDSSTQTFVFDPGIRVLEFRTEASLCYNRTRGRVLHKKRSLMQEQFNATAVDLILLYFT
ncbi:hypothetical protein QL285_075476 [Trifolium repens]|nr:hypothetical protein QL285_075476 [Trifolium repens]